MQRPLVVLLALVALVGCRTPPPSMDPFLRTTVPPPGTTGAGQQYYQAAPPAAEPATPTVVPPAGKYAPPGGSFNYQSSIDRPKAAETGATGFRMGNGSITKDPGVAAAAATSAPAVNPAGFSTPAVAVNAESAQPASTEPESAEPAIAQPVTLASGHSLAREHSQIQFAGGATAAGAPTLAGPQPTAARVQLQPEGVNTATFREAVDQAADEAASNTDDDRQSFAAGSVADNDTQAELTTSGAGGGTTIRILEPRTQARSDWTTTDTNETTSVSAADAPAGAGVNEITTLPLANPAHRAAATSWTRAGVGLAPDSAGSLTNANVANGNPAATASGFRLISSGTVLPSGASTGGAVQLTGDYAFAPDYSALRGRLEYSQSARQWKLRYIPIDGQTDQYGGSVVLAQAPLLDAYKAGDYVAVSGNISPAATAKGGFSPLYEPRGIERIAR